jgi:hypothetical protein
MLDLIPTRFLGARLKSGVLTIVIPTAVPRIADAINLGG